MENGDTSGTEPEEPDLEMDGGVECPVCDSEFESQRGMEAHVSGSNGEHEGMVGKDVRDELKGAIEFPENPEANGDDDLVDDALDNLDDELLDDEDGDDLDEVENDSGDTGLKGVISVIGFVAVVLLLRGGGLNPHTDAGDDVMLL